MKKNLFFILLLLSFLAACVKKENEAGKHDTSVNVEEKVVATIGDKKLGIEEFNRAFSSVRKGYPEKLTPALKLTISKLKKEFLEKLVEEKLLVMLAEEKGVHISPEELDREVAKVTGESFEGAKKLVEAEGVVFSEWLNEIKRKSIVNKLLKEEIYDKVKVLEEEVKEYFRHNSLKFTQREAVHLLQIVAETEAEAFDIIRKLKKRANFKKLARSVVGEPSYEVDLGFVKKGELIPKLQKAAFSLKKGQITDVISTPYGYHILKCVGTKKSRLLTFKESRPLIEKSLRKSKSAKLYNEWLKEKRGSIDIFVNLGLLSKS